MLSAGAGLRAEGPAQGGLPLPEELYPQLKTILTAALTQSPQMLQRNLDIAQAEANKISVTSQQLPNLGGSISYSRSTNAISSVASSKSQADGIYYGFSVGQALFQWGTLRAQTESAKIGVLIAEKNLVEAYRQLALQIRLQYLGLIIKKQSLRNAEHWLGMATVSLALEEEKLRIGTISPGEILPPRMLLEEATLARDRAAADLAQGLRLLARMAGLPMMSAAEVPDQIKPLGQPSLRAFTGPMVGKFMSGDVQKAPQAQIYRHYLEQTDLAYKVAKYRLYPKFSLSGGYSLNNATSVTGDTLTQAAYTSQYISVTGSWTIFDGFSTKASKMSVLVTKRTYQMQYENYLRTATEQAQDLERQLDFSARAMRLADTRRDMQAGSKELAAEEFQRGVIGERAVAISQQSFNQADLSANMARAELIGKWAEFLSALNLDPAIQSLPAKYLRHAK